MFEPNSRYYGVETATVTAPDGRLLTYVRRRRPPASGELRVLTEISVAQGDRLDLVTARTLGDPEQFWRVCDANDALDPAELTAEVGRVVLIPLPEA
ncbi:MAG TPA: hypothetical protein VHJ34_04525 [Actinomycetota bacterium]|nr:hypothetical protein [Actinomycetota bacterium]